MRRGLWGLFLRATICLVVFFSALGIFHHKHHWLRLEESRIHISVQKQSHADDTKKAPPLSQSKQVSDGATENNSVTDAVNGTQERVDGKDDPDAAVTQKFQDRELILDMSMGQGGLCNQAQCFQMAAVLAVQYNRTLVYPRFGYQSSPVHGGHSILVENLLDISKLPLRFKLHQQRQRPHLIDGNTLYGRDNLHHYDMPSLSRVIKWDPLEKSPHSRMYRDPYPDKARLSFKCQFGFTQYVLPERLFPQQSINFFPFHPSFREDAHRIIQEMKRRSNEIGTSDFKVLGVHIRLGDRASWPLLPCHAVPKYPNLAFGQGQGGLFSSRCSSARPREHQSTNNATTNTTTNSVLTWEKFWEFSKCRGNKNKRRTFPVCMEDYDAVFVATNQSDYIKSLISNSSSNVYFLSDFVIHRTDPIERFVVELMVLAEAHRVILSFGTSITDLLLRMRLSNNASYHDAYDVELNQTFWKAVLERNSIWWPSQPFG